MSNDSYYLILEHRNYKVVDELRKRIEVLSARITSLEALNHELELKYGFECHLNYELCDLLRKHDIDFRPTLESSKSSF